MKHSMQLLFVGCLLLGLAPQIAAQDTLQLESAINSALQNNHGIKVARNEVQVSKNLATRGNAGLLPSLGLSGGGSYSLKDTKLELAGENPNIDQKGAQSIAYNLGINASYSLIGFQSLYSYQQLVVQSEFAQLQSRGTIENTLINLILAYYEAAGYQEQLDIARENMSISKERYKRARLNYGYGNTTRIDVLNAQVDLNTDSVSLKNAVVNLANSKRSLAYQMGQPDLEFSLSRRVEFAEEMTLESMQQLALNNNVSVLQAASNLRNAKLSEQIAKSSRLPTVNLTGSYGLNQSNTDAGIVTSNRQVGLDAGVTLSYNLFNGGQTNTQLRNAQIAMENNRELQKDAEELIKKEVTNGLATYHNSLEVLTLEQVSVETAQLNFERTKEQYQLGNLTNTQFREAQLNLIQALSRIVNARFQAKVAELQLLRLTGALVSGE